MRAELICIIVLIVVVAFLSAILLWNTITVQKQNPVDQESDQEIGEDWKPFKINYTYVKNRTLVESLPAALVSHIFVKDSFEEIEKTFSGKSTVNFFTIDKDPNFTTSEDSKTNKKRVTAKMSFLSPFHTLEKEIKTYAENIDDETFITILDGEPNDVFVKAKNISLFITTKKKILDDPLLKDKSIHIPYFAFSIREFGIVASTLFASKRYINIDDWQKRQFCFYGQSNASVTRFEGVQKRGRFFQFMKRRFGPGVRNLGKSDRNLNESPSTYKQITSEKYIDKFEHGTNMFLMKEFKFCICFENSSLEGYVTEKVMEPLLGHAIPIYCGAPDVNNYINPDCFINVNDYDSWEDLCDDIEVLEHDEKRLKTMLEAPVFVEKLKNEPVIKSFIEGKGAFFRKCFEILPLQVKNHVYGAKIYDCNIHAITFADGTVCSSDRIQNEMKTCGYFDSFCAFNTSDIDEFNPIFKHWKTQKSQKGFGFYAWKPFFIYQSLLSMNNGDILVWLDAGSHLKPNLTSEIVRYYDKLVHTDTDIFAFEIDYLEEAYSKKITIEEVIRTYPENAKEKLKAISNQICTSNIMFKKNEKTVEFAKMWMDLSFKDNMKFINDDISNNESSVFVAHRWDQSIFSMLCKLSKCNTYISRDCFDEANIRFDDVVIQPRRWRK